MNYLERRIFFIAAHDGLGCLAVQSITQFSKRRKVAGQARIQESLSQGIKPAVLPLSVTSCKRTLDRISPRLGFLSVLIAERRACH